MPNLNWGNLLKNFGHVVLSGGDPIFGVLGGAHTANSGGGSIGDKGENALTMGLIDRPREKELELERTAAAGVEATAQAASASAYEAARKKKADDAQALIDNRARIIAEQYAKKKTLTGGRSTLGYKSILGE